MSVQACISNNNELAKLIEKQIRGNQEKALRKVGFFCENEAKKLAQDRIYSIPVKSIYRYKRTGAYRAHIESKVISKDTVELRNMIHYAVYVEYKHGTMIMTDATHGKIDEIAKIYAKEITEGVGK